MFSAPLPFIQNPLFGTSEYALDSQNDFDYAIFKFKGKAKYILEIESFKSPAFNHKTPHFKIIDGTKRKEAQKNCASKPKLFIKNMVSRTKRKDIVLKKNGIIA